MTRLTITRLGHHGDGVADGPVYVPRTLPGEVVEGAVTGTRMDTPRIIAPAPERVAAPCPHYRRCGGCALQHARADFVTRWKQDVIVQALAAQGLTARQGAPHVSPPASRRRATFAGRRLKSGALVGFHARGSDTVTAVPDCRVLHPELLGALPALEELTALAGTRKGTLALSLTASRTGPDLAVRGLARAPDVALRTRLAALAGRAGLARLTCDGEIVAQDRAPVHRLGRAEVTPPPGAFLQATRPGEAALQAAVARALAGSTRVVDLYAGCGTFTLPLAEGAAVHAVEGAGAMLAALDHGWRHARGLRRVSHATRDLARAPLTPAELAGYDGAVIDPPRAGAPEQARALAGSAVPRIAAVSCNPATFARDAALLVAGGYRLDWVQMIDQFRHSPHVELAASFTRPHTVPSAPPAEE